MAKKVSIILGIVFVVVGILGFISNPLIGDGGYFHTDTVHNIVHIVIGLVLLAFANATTVLVVGVVYLLLAVIGFIAGGDTLLWIVESNSADNWLHLVLGVVMVVLGLVTKGGSSVAPSEPTM